MSERAPAPLLAALRALAARGTARFHMPGHKGRPLPYGLSEDLVALDFTELPGTGNLYEGTGPIREAERAAAAFYGARDALFLTGGSSQGVLAALAAVCPPGGTLVCDRASHRSAAHAMVLLDLRPRYVAPAALPSFPAAGGVDPAALDRALGAQPGASAVFLTAPNYYGAVPDVAAAAAVCRAHGVPLVVDAAHAAHFPALGLPSAVECGADLAVCSLHKTAPALGQSALLLCGREFPDLRGHTALFGTSSPSYAMMASMDAARAWLSGEGGARYREVASFADGLRRELAGHGAFRALTASDARAGFCTGIDPCRLSVRTAGAGLPGREAARLLSERYGVVCEMADCESVVLILTGADTDGDGARLRDALLSLAVQAPGPSGRAERAAARPGVPFAGLSPREAYFSPRERRPLRECEGRVAAAPVTVYPPGVIIFAPGEIIDKKSIEFLYENSYNENSPVEVVCGRPQRPGPDAESREYIS